jgi:hypothetical protein
MAELTTQISGVRLARDRVRLYRVPVALLLLAAGAAVGGVLLRGPAGISLAALGAVAALAGIYLVALVSSYRLLVEPGGLRLRWLGGEHRYRLVRGQVTRVVVPGGGTAVLHPRFGGLGWAVGPAVLRGQEQIELIRLSLRPALIVVPTDRGRLAIAAAVESDLLAALAHAVRLQERVDEVAARRAMPPPAVAAAAGPAQPPAPRVLTGIERTLIEQRLAAERAAGMAAAAAEEPAPAAAEQPAPAAATAEVAPLVAAPVVAQPPTPVRAAVAPRVTRRRERARWERPGWLAVPGPASVVSALPVALPLVGAVIAWITVTVTGRPVLPADEARLLLAALALAGPAGALGAFIARTWYPRLGGLVAASSIAALALLTRTILA